MKWIFAMILMVATRGLAGVFDVEPFPTPNYPYRVHEQSSTVASGALERAEASVMVTGNANWGGPNYSVRWGFPYSAYTRTLYSKYNLGNALEPSVDSYNKLRWLNRAFAVTAPLTDVSQFVYHTSVDGFLTGLSPTNWYVNGNLIPVLDRMQLATVNNGLRGSPVLTNLSWNSADGYWFNQAGSTLNVAENVPITLNFTNRVVTTSVPRVDTVEELTEAPSPSGTVPYGTVPSWWIPYSDWDYIAPDKPSADLDWDGGTLTDWGTTQNETVKYLRPTVDQPSAFYEPIFGGAVSNNYYIGGPLYVYSYKQDQSVPFPYRDIFSPGRSVSIPYATGWVMCSGLRVSFDAVPDVNLYVVYSENDAGAYLRQRFGSAVDPQAPVVTVNNPPVYSWSLPTPDSMTVQAGTVAVNDRGHNMGYSYSIPFTGTQRMKWRTSWTAEYATRLEEQGRPGPPHTWDYDETLFDLPLTDWVVMEESLTLGSMIDTNKIQGVIDAYRTATMTRQLSQLPIMSWGQVPLLDFYSRASLANPVVCLALDQAWDTTVDLLDPVMGYPTVFEDLGIFNFTPDSEADYSWSVNSIANACHYDMSYVYTGDFVTVYTPYNVKKTHVLDVTSEAYNVVLTNTTLEPRTTVDIAQYASIAFQEDQDMNLGGEFSYGLYTIEVNGGGGGTKYRSQWDGGNMPFSTHPVIITSSDDSKTIGILLEFWREDGVGFTHYVETTVPPAGIIIGDADMNGQISPEPPYDTYGGHTYYVTNRLVESFNTTLIKLTLEAVEEPHSAQYRENPIIDVCWGNVVVPQQYGGAPVAYSWGPTYWTNTIYGGGYTATTNVTTYTDSDAYAVWTNTTTNITVVGGTVAKWIGTRWIPTGVMETHLAFDWALPEKYQVFVWNQVADLVFGYPPEYPENTVTGRAEYVTAQWEVILEYTQGARLLEYFADYYTDPMNVLKWDNPTGFKIQ